MLGTVLRIALLALLSLFVALTGVFGAESRVAGCAPNFHWTDFGPVWSPTGEKIAYQRIEIGCFSPIKTYVIGADRGTPVRMPLDGGRPSWSPDGRRLAFSYNLLIAN